MSKFKETPGDLAVKASLWLSTEKQAMHFARRYASEHIVGEAYSDAQKDVTTAGKAKGYPKGLIRKLGRSVLIDERMLRAFTLANYRAKIGL